jgi:hypothetical protein
MQNIISGFDTLVKNTSFSGNTTIDLILMSHIIPIVISYIQFLISSTTNIIRNLFQFIICYIKYFLKKKYIGEIIYTMSVDYKSELYIFLEDHIFIPTIRGDIENNYFDSILETSNSTNENDNWISKYFELRKYLKLFINYERASKSNINIIDGIENKSESNKHYIEESKNFKYNNYILKIKFGGHNYKNEISIDIISYDRYINKHNDYLKLIENFLNERFNMNNKMAYVYRLYISNSALCNILNLFLTNFKCDHVSGLLSCGEIRKRKSINDSISGKMTIAINNAVINNPDKDYLDDIEIYNNDTSETNGDLDDFKSLYYKFLSNEENKLSGNDRTGFYYRDEKTIMIRCIVDRNNISNQVSESYIYIISHGKILKRDDITNEINYIIKSYLTQNTSNKNENKIPKIYSRKRGQWVNQSCEKRDFATIYLPTEQLNDIKTEINNFINTKKLYDAFQISYRKGLLFYGPPGTGKTSLIKAIANEYGLDIYLININDQDINDDTICDILGSISRGGNRILLFEDIDSAFSDKESVKFENKNVNNNQLNDNYVTDKNESNKFLTYSGLLNALDGLKSSHNGVITIMTTNNINKLGDAFIRPGRIDKKFELTYCNNQQIHDMLKSFIGKILGIIDNNKYKIDDLDENKILDLKINDFIKNIDNIKIKPCELQSYIMKYIEDIDSMLDSYHELFH